MKHSSTIKFASDRKPQFVIGGYVIEFVDSWPHLGHIIASSNDDNLDILNRRNSLCVQINDVLCYFGSRGPLTKLRLLKAYSSSYYGCELWDLSCKAVGDICMMWRKRLKRVWGLPRDTHSCLLASLCASIPIVDELCRRSCNFINACLSSDCFLISFVARQSIFYSRMASPLGRNTHFCCMRYGERTQDISFIRNNYIYLFIYFANHIKTYKII